MYHQAGWLESSPDGGTAFLKDIVKNSAVFVGAFHKKKLIGMGRALSDSVSDAYIQDITVLKSYRGRGIGERIVRLIVHHLKLKNVDWIGLVAEPGTYPFYEKIGFKPLEGYLPLKYKEE